MTVNLICFTAGALVGFVLSAMAAVFGEAEDE